MVVDSGHQSLTQGQLELYVPNGWIDLLGAGSNVDDDHVARCNFAELLQQTLPALSPAEIEQCAEALLGWRRQLLALGAVSHGIVNCPAELRTVQPNQRVDGGPRWNAWHIVTAVTALPSLSSDVDLGELLARLIGSGLPHGAAHTESFATDMGCGAGLILQPPLASVSANQRDLIETDLPSPGEALRYGLAAALACRPGGGPALVVVGVCIDPEQVLDLAAVVAVIAGRSTVSQPELRQKGSYDRHRP